MRFRYVVSLAVAALGAGCASDESPQLGTHRYSCDDGLAFTATYYQAAQTAAIRLSTGANDTLKQEVSASGSLYASERHRLHTRGDEALLDTRDDGVTHRCVAARQ